MYISKFPNTLSKLKKERGYYGWKMSKLNYFKVNDYTVLNTNL